MSSVSELMARRQLASPSPHITSTLADLDCGQRAKVVGAFVNGEGRVFVSGAEWPAEISGEAPAAGESVIVDAVAGPTLKVRAV